MLKLILADNQAIFRAGIAKVLAVEDEMRIVAQAQTPEQMFMALDKFRAAVLVVAAGFHNDFAAIVNAANKAKTRVIVLADTGESAQKHMSNGAHDAPLALNGYVLLPTRHFGRQRDFEFHGRANLHRRIGADVDARRAQVSRHGVSNHLSLMNLDGQFQRKSFSCPRFFGHKASSALARRYCALGR